MAGGDELIYGYRFCIYGDQVSGELSREPVLKIIVLVCLVKTSVAYMCLKL